VCIQNLYGPKVFLYKRYGAYVVGVHCLLQDVGYAQEVIAYVRIPRSQRLQFSRDCFGFLYRRQINFSPYAITMAKSSVLEDWRDNIVEVFISDPRKHTLLSASAEYAAKDQSLCHGLG